MDPNVKTGVDVDSLAAAAAPGGGGTMSYDTASALLAAAAAGSGAALGLGGEGLGATLTSDPEELNWLGTVRRLHACVVRSCILHRPLRICAACCCVEGSAQGYPAKRRIAL